MAFIDVFQGCVCPEVSPDAYNPGTGSSKSTSQRDANRIGALSKRLPNLPRFRDLSHKRKRGCVVDGFSRRFERAEIAFILPDHIAFRW